LANQVLFMPPLERGHLANEDTALGC